MEPSGGVDTVHGISQLEGSGVPCTTSITTTSSNTTTDCAPKPTDSVEIQITTPEGTVRPRQNEASTDVAQEDIQSTAEGNEVDGTLVGKTNVLSEPKLEDDQQKVNLCNDMRNVKHLFNYFPQKYLISAIICLKKLLSKVARVVGAKVTLAARVDSFHQVSYHP